MEVKVIFFSQEDFKACNITEYTRNGWVPHFPAIPFQEQYGLAGKGSLYFYLTLSRPK